MREEQESINIYRQLIRDGYLLEPSGDTWSITEPNSRKMPQQTRALRSMREALQWANGVDAIRFVTSTG